MNPSRTAWALRDLSDPKFSDGALLFTPVDSVREVYARFARRDLAAVFELLSPDFEVTQATQLPWGGRFHGVEGAWDFFSRLNQHTEGFAEPATYLPAGSDVAVTGRFRGCARATGRLFDVGLVHLWTVRAGRMTRCAAFVDTPAMLAALQP